MIATISNIYICHRILDCSWERTAEMRESHRP